MLTSGGGCQCLHVLAPLVRNQCSVCIWKGRPSLVQSHLGTGQLLGATWRHQGGAKRARVRHSGAEDQWCHQFMLPWHGAWSTAMPTRGEQPVWAGRGLWRGTLMTKGRTDGIERDMS